MTRHNESVQDVMTWDALTISPGASLADAYNLMTENEVRRLPVVRGDELVGIVTLSDVLQAVSALVVEGDTETKLLLTSRRVQDVMSWNPVSCEPEDTIQEAAERMLEYQVSGLPVVQGQHVVGIITESDIFRLVVESWSDDE